MAKGKKPARTPWADARAEQFSKDETEKELPRGYRSLKDWESYGSAKQKAFDNPTRETLLAFVKEHGPVYVNGNHQIRSSLFRTLLNRGEVKMVRLSRYRPWHTFPDGSKKKCFRGNGQSVIVLADKE